jgi:ubiquinone/menaquinone biosynthesis C-methylase UbiE
MATTSSPATFEELHVSYPDESVTETICQYAYDEVLQRIPKDKVVVDIGCGIGTLASRIAGFSKEVVGVDIAPERIERAKALHETKNLRFYAGDAYHLPLDSQSVDVVVSFAVFHHLELARMVPEMRRVLKRAGIVFIVDIYEGFQRPSARVRTWLRMFRRDGALLTLSTFAKMLPLYMRKKNRQHRRNDSERMKRLNTYTFQGFREQYSKHLPGCTCGEDIVPFVYCQYVIRE